MCTAPIHFLFTATLAVGSLLTDAPRGTTVHLHGEEWSRSAGAAPSVRLPSDDDACITLEDAPWDMIRREEEDDEPSSGSSIRA